MADTIKLTDIETVENANDIMLSTVDNPFNPFIQFDEWFQFDQQKGYNSLELVDRLINDENNSKRFDDMNETEQEEAQIRAINTILRLDPLGVYRRVRPNSEIKPIQIDELLSTKETN